MTNPNTFTYNNTNHASLPVIGNGKSIPAGVDFADWHDQAGFFTVGEAPVKFATSVMTGGIRTEGLNVVPDRKVLFRQDTNAPLSVVGDGYKVVQPMEILDFYRDLVEDNGMQLVMAGVNKGGQKIWTVAVDKTGTLSLGNDKSESCLLIQTSYDGKSSTTIDPIDLRYICANVTSMAKGKIMRISHRQAFNAEAIIRELQGYGIQEKREEFCNNAENMAAKGLSDQQVAELFTEILAKRDDKDRITNESQVKKIGAEMFNCYMSGPGANLPSANGTAWGAFNAVTYHTDHFKKARNEDNRFNSACFGTGADLKERALKVFLDADGQEINSVDDSFQALMNR